MAAQTVEDMKAIWDSLPEYKKAVADKPHGNSGVETWRRKLLTM